MNAPEQEQENYLNYDYGWKSWLFTLDHKRIAILYLISITVFFVLGGLAAALVRIQLLTPQGAIMTPEMYNRTFTMHGVVMVFLFLIPSVPAVFGNFVVPLQIGAKDLAFPRLNLFSWYLYIAGGALAVYAIVMGGVDTGWTFYTPYSSIYSNSHVIVMGLGIFVAGFSSIATAINIIVTVHRMRAPGLTWFRLPLFVWANYATALVIVLGTPVLAITLLLLVIERSFGIGIFDPRLGGDPVLFQHMFWFYSHPAVYIMILPGMGVVSELITTFAKRRLFGYRFVAMSTLAIAGLGFLVWGHHMFITSQSPYAGMVFALISFLVAVPSAIKVFNWCATLHRGQITFETPMMYALGFIGLFTIGGLTGLFLSAMAVDMHVTDTYFVVAHFHYIMVGGMVMAYMGALHYWWPKMTGRMYPRFWGIISAGLIFVGFNLTFFPQFVLGYLGMPRRYYSYPDEFQALNVMSTAGASILGFGYLLPLIYFIWSLKRGAVAGPNPWGATGLEWTIPSPPPVHNFNEPVVVTEAPYQYKETPEDEH